jgi:serine/threonine protein kinase
MPEPTHSDENTGTTPPSGLTPKVPPPSGDAIPERIGRYEVQSLLGEGAYGRVFLALDAELDRLVAIKVPKFAAMTPELRERFLREAKATAKIEHQNVCPIFDIGTDGELPFFVMLYVAGTTLGAHLDKWKVLPPQNAVALAQRLALGIAAAHERGVIHRDLKPQNILFDADKQRALITDFGLARIGAGSQATAVGTVFGTPFYMSPEQARGETAEIGPLSDVYSLGVILYRMLTGSLPFTGTVYEVLLAHTETPPPRPSTVRRGLDARLDALVLKAMAKKPRDRYPSARAFADALGIYLNAASTAWLAADETQGPKPGKPAEPAAPSTGSEATRIKTGSGGASGTRGPGSSSTRRQPPPVSSAGKSGRRPVPKPEPEPEPLPLDDEPDRGGALRTKVLLAGIAFLLLAIFVIVGVLVAPQLMKPIAKVDPPPDPGPVESPPGPPKPVDPPTPANNFAGHAFDQAAERRAAEWVLASGGAVQIVSKDKAASSSTVKGIGESRPVSRVEDLPAEFTVAFIDLHAKPELTDAAFAAGVARLSGPVEIHLSHCHQLTDESLKVLARIPKLTGLHLESVRGFTDAGLAALAGHPAVEELTLVKTGVTKEGMKAVAKLPAVARLRVDVEDPSAWLPELAPLANLADLSLDAHDSNEFTDRCFAHLKPFKKLTRLALTGRNVTDEWLAPISEIGTLVRLELVNSHISGAGLVHLKKLPNLKAVSLAESTVKNEGMMHLAECPALEELDLTDTVVGDDGLLALSKRATLRKVVLLRSNVSAQGVREFGGALPKCQVFASER